MIRSIELRNWKTHRHTVMNFQKGVNVLVGVMGAGKSSVIDGISFGLFGTFPSLVHKRTTIANLISSRPTVENEAEVRIIFTVGNDEYAVTRKIGRAGGTSAKLEKNGAYLQTQPARVNEEICALMKTDYDTFSRAIYAEQNRLDYFLELAKGDRKKQIDQMLGLDSFARAEENSTSLLNSIKSTIAEDERQLDQYNITEMKSQLESLVREKQQLGKEQSELEARLKESESKRDALAKSLDELRKKGEKKKSLEKEMERLSSRISTIDRELKAIGDFDMTIGQADAELASETVKQQELDNVLKRKRNEIESSTRRLADAESMARQLSEKIKKRDELLEFLKGMKPELLEKDANESDSRIRECLNHISTLKANRAEDSKWMKELEGHMGKCPICDSVLEDAKRKSLLDQKAAAIRDADQKVYELEKSRAKMEIELASMRKQLESVSSAASKLSDLQSLDAPMRSNLESAAKERAALESLKSEAEEAAKELDRINKSINELRMKRESISRKEKYRQEIKASSEELDAKAAESKLVDFDERMLYEAQERITAIASSIAEASSKIEGNRKYSKSIEAQADSKVREIAAYDAIRVRIESRGAHVQSVSKFRMALLDTETQLRNSLVNSINMLMRDIWPKLYPYADYSAVRLDARKDDYCLEAGTGMDSDGNVQWAEIDGMASGGERSTACLTMRIALAMVIVPNLKWLILDEPTHNIDERGIGRFIEVLANTLPSVVEQIFIITHDSALKNISSARVYSLERNKDRNEHTNAVEA